MNILFHLHAYPNEVLAGAETMAHKIARYLVSEGHQVKVLSLTATKKKNYLDGVEVLSWKQGEDDRKEWTWSDLVITHLGNTYHCFNRARQFNKKLVHLVHNSYGDHILRCRVNANYIVYNSEYVKRILKYEQPNCVCIPPVDYRDYQNVKNSGDYITLINLNENKGGQMLIELAKRLPQYKFLGVQGGYYEQIQDNSIKNIKYIEPQSDIKKVYEKSKIVLMPSQYESYGQVAIESISCGIPVINSTAKGLSEALNQEGIDINKIDLWVKEIELLMTDKDVYKKRSEQSKQRAKELDPKQYLSNLNQFLKNVHNVKTWRQ
jgi:glycosyltransferase involved in cell wall biosynthesis